MRLTDRFAYINHDIDDALRAGLLEVATLPAEPIAVLGDSGSARIDTLVHDLVEHSERAGAIVQGERAAAAMIELRNFMFEHVYLGAVARREHAQDRDGRARACSSTTVDTPSAAALATSRDRPRDARDRLHRGHDRPLLHPRLRGARRAAGVRP